MTLPAEGTVLAAKYRIDRYIGEGGMSAVARCRHLDREADVALKFLLPEGADAPQAIARFRREAVAASRLDTDHVARIYDVGEADGITYLVMELLEGEDLDRLLARERTIPVPRAIHLTLQLLRALAVAHRAGVVHRDVKPGNVWLCSRDGETDFVKLLDFGISRIADRADGRLTQADTSMGTPLYMAPEQARDASAADARSDLYAVGALLYELLAGQPPLGGETTNAVLFRVFQEVPARLDASRPHIPAELADVVAACLAKDPAQRPVDAAALAAALAPFADERSRRVLAAFDQIAPSSRGSLATSPRESMALARTLAASALPVPVAPTATSRRTGAALGLFVVAGGLLLGAALVTRTTSMSSATGTLASGDAGAEPLKAPSDAPGGPAGIASAAAADSARPVVEASPDTSAKGPASEPAPPPAASARPARAVPGGPGGPGAAPKRGRASAFDLGILR